METYNRKTAGNRPAITATAGASARCWQTYERGFRRMCRQGLFYPLDEEACRQEGRLALARAAERLAKGEVTLENCTPATYCVAAGMKRLQSLHRRQVAAERERQRTLADLCHAHGADDVHALVEALPALRTADDALAQNLAQTCVAETLARCSPETRRALAAYLAADLCAQDAARALGLARQTFQRRRDRDWFPEFRRACAWRW